MDNKVKVLWISDFVVQTGFSRVAEGILKYLPQDIYDFHILAINYAGDPHPFSYKIYPASLMGDIIGVNRVQSLCELIKPDLIFILADIWNIDQFLTAIKRTYTNKVLPKIVIYFPVDAEDHLSDWYKNLDIVYPVVYNTFGFDVATKAASEYKYKIISHGIDSEDFFKIETNKTDIKKTIYPNEPEYYDDSFIVLNANRNQPRKKLDLTLQAFALFSKGKPENVKLHMHCGLVDESINVDILSKRYGIDKRVILSSRSRGALQVPKFILNRIYNATEVGINTSLGEGFGLCNAEHAITGVPQIVPDHSALHDLYRDCGILVPANTKWTLDKIMTVGKIVDPIDVASALDRLYKDKDLYKSLAEKSFVKFNSEQFSWKYISNQWHELFQEVL